MRDRVLPGIKTVYLISSSVSVPCICILSVREGREHKSGEAGWGLRTDGLVGEPAGLVTSDYL